MITWKKHIGKNCFLEYAEMFYLELNLTVCKSFYIVTFMMHKMYEGVWGVAWLLFLKH